MTVGFRGSRPADARDIRGGDWQVAPTPDDLQKRWVEITGPTERKMLINALYHSAVITGLAMGYSRLGKMAIGGPSPKLEPTGRDIGMVIVEVALAMFTKDMLIKQGMIPADIVTT